MKGLGFSRKILIAAALTVILVFSAFIYVSDYRQRQALRGDVDAKLQQLGMLSAHDIQTWLESRMLLIQTLGQRLNVEGTDKARVLRAINLPVYAETFQLISYGGSDGSMYSLPESVRAADYIPGCAAGTKRRKTDNRRYLLTPTSRRLRENW